MKATIKKIIQETHDTKTFVLKLTTPMNYKTAQFVMLELGGDVPRRAFSISCSPDPNKVEVTARIYSEGKFTSQLNKLKEGDDLEVKGPHGHFIYESGHTTVIGAGTGIAPLRGIMQCAVNEGQEVEVHHMDKTEGDLIFKEELEGLRNQRKIKLSCVVTREPDSHLAGRIDASYLRRKITSKDGTFYICGPPDFVNSTIDTLKKLKISEEQIKKEKF